MVSAFRTTLAKELGEPLDLYEVPLELTRFSGPEGEAPLVAFLAGRIKSQPVDLVVTIGAAGAAFADRHREQLFPDTPVLAVAADPRMVPTGFLQKTNSTSLITSSVNLPGMIEDILQLQPQTTNIVVVIGASALEKAWLKECRREFQAFTNRVGFTWLEDLTLKQVLDRCATLPPRSFILNPLFIQDAARVPCERNESIRRLHEVANAPLFGYFKSEFGLGPIGGRLFQDTEAGEQGGLAAVRLLQGETTRNIPPLFLPHTTPTYDWRELKRWGIDTARLPPGSRIEFYQPGFWERYRWPVLGVIAFCCLQTALIVSLIINRSKRRQGEVEATLMADISSKFVNLPPTEVDREILTAERRICEALGLDVSSLWQWSAQNTFLLTHFHGNLVGPPPPDQMDASVYFPWCQARILAGHIIKVSSLQDLPAEAARDRETWRHLGIKTSLTLPLSVGGAPPIGALSFNSVQAERDWPDTLVKRLQVVAQIFANALARKRADQSLRESELRLKLAADSADAGLWELDYQTQEFWATEKTRNIFEFTLNEIISMERIKKAVHPEDWPLIQEAMERSLHAIEPVEVEYRIRLADGRERWISSRGKPIFKAGGEPDRLLGISLDITERKQAEERMRQLSHTVEQSPVLITITDRWGNIIYVNRKFTEVTGYTLEECVGKNPRILKSGELSPAVYRNLWDSITSGKTWRGEFHNRKKNGELYWESAVISPVSDTDGRITHFIGVKEDITQRKQTDAAMHDLSRRLIRAHEAERARLGRELHDDVTQRMARLAIDIGRVEQSADKVLLEETLRSVREGLVRLSADIHALSYRLHPSVLEDLGLVEALKAECERFSRQEPIQTEVRFQELPAVLSPETSLCLFRVAQEALRNAARHSRAGKVEITLRTLGNSLQMAVIDDGIGFDPAVQRDRPSLGLASMRERVLLLAGEIDIESEPGKGTTILASVPLQENIL